MRQISHQGLFGALAVMLALGALSTPRFVVGQAGEKQPPVQAGERQPPVQEDEALEPAFPELVPSRGDGHQMREPTLKLVTETLVKDRPITTQEEYLDLRQAKAAYVQVDSQEIVYANAREPQVLKYKPYSCEAFAAGEPVFAGLDDWALVRSYQWDRTLRIFGVAAMWLWAENQPKMYSRDAGYASALSKEIYAQAHVWTVDDAAHNVKLEFRFVAHRKAPEAELSLESVRLVGRTGGQLLKTINVLSLEYTLSNAIYESLLSFPVGYDCVKIYTGTGALDEVDQDDKSGGGGDGDQLNGPHQDDFWLEYAYSNSRVTFEVTATKMEAASEIGVRSTDTMVVEIAHAHIGQSVLASSSDAAGDLLMTRVKSSKQETKTILNHLYSVRYHIDERLGTCSLAHMPTPGPSRDSQEALDMTQDNLMLEFANDLTLALHKKRLREMFASDSSTLFKLVKTYRRFVGENKALVYQIYERPSYAWGSLANTKGGAQVEVLAREMKTLVMSQTIGKSLFDGTPQTRDSSAWRLESYTIWLLDKDTQSKILATYHLNLIDEEGPLDEYPDQAALFDVSEECFLENPAKKSGLDYAWVELFYPISSRQLDVLVDQESQLKQVLYGNLMKLPLVTSFSLPRLEVMFSDEGLVVRFLLLDLPPVELLYDSLGDKMLSMRGAGYKEHTQDFTVPDLAHCSRLCQMYSCLTMSFWEATRSCMVSTRPVLELGNAADAEKGTEFAELQDCKGSVAYGTTRTSLARKLRDQRLSNVLSALQHQDYDDIRLPAMPDEVALPREETGVDETTYRKALSDYIDEVATFMAERDFRLPSLTLSIMFNGHFVAALPTRFTLENDPLDDLGLEYSAATGAGDDDQAASTALTFRDSILFDPAQVDKFFHAGLSQRRFDVNALVQKPQLGMRVLQGLSYDQCALACLDSKCASFSHCTTSNECVLTRAATQRQLQDEKLIINDSSCMVSMRDFLANYQQFPAVYAPAKGEIKREESSFSANDCALQCARETDFNCLSFEYCPTSTTSRQDDPGVCFMHDTRHPDSIFTRPKRSKKQNKKQQQQPGDNSTASSGPQCDHYERSYLAEFTHIEGRELAQDELVKLKTTEYQGKTSFECADICLNQMADCSAFQFCYEPTRKQRKSKYAQSCVMVESQPASEEERKELEVLVDSTGQQDKLVKGGESLLVQNSNCQVFALKPSSLQAHLRDLAMGQTMTERERAELDAQRGKSASGFTFTWFGFIFMLIFMLVVSTLAGYGFAWARVNNEKFRSRVDRVRILVGL